MHTLCSILYRTHSHTSCSSTRSAHTPQQQLQCKRCTVAHTMQQHTLCSSPHRAHIPCSSPHRAHTPCSSTEHTPCSNTCIVQILQQPSQSIHHVIAHTVCTLCSSSTQSAGITAALTEHTPCSSTHSAHTLQQQHTKCRYYSSSTCSVQILQQ